MKKRILKVVTAWALVLCMTIPMMLSVQAQEDVVGDVISKETFVVQHHSAIDTYRTGEKFTAPDAPSGYTDYLFAGWYADENCETPKDDSYTNGEAYAKFVHKDVLGVKAQVISGTNFNTEQADLRFVSTVDSLDYLEVGFNLKIYGEEPNYNTDVVYHKLYAMNNTGAVLNEYTPDLFHESSEYFFACIVTGVDNTVFDYGIQVAPYWVTPDGTTVQAEYVTKSVSDGYMFKSMDADVAPEGEINLADYTLQGGSIGGAYYYLVAVNAENTSTKIYRLKRNDENTAWNTNKETEQAIAGVSDITYNGTEKVLVMVNNSEVTLIDRSSLETTTSETITTTSIELDIESIKYNKNHNKYVVMLADGSLSVLDTTFSATNVTTTVPTGLADYTAQSVTADDSYIYQAFAKTDAEVADNKIAVYKWDGSYVTTINVALKEHEITTIDISNNVIYAACDTADGISLYNIDILKTFDIVYKLNGGTTTSPTGYTKNSGEIAIEAPERYGYEFLGWSEETVSLADVVWKDGLADPKNGNGTITATGWENAQNTGGLYLKDGLQHTLMYGKQEYDKTVSDLRWRLFKTDALTNSTDVTRTSVGYLLADYPYAVLSLKTLENIETDALYIKSEYVNEAKLTYTDGSTKKSIVLNWTKGFINENKPWSVTYNHDKYPNTVYSQEIQVKNGVTYTLDGENFGTNKRCRVMPEGEEVNVTNFTFSGTSFTATKDATVRIMLLDGYSEYTDATIKSGSTGNRTYTANWARNSFKVQYDANGGNGTMEDSIHEFAVDSQLSVNTFVKEGYGFTGWNTAADGSGTDYVDAATIKNLTTDESITLYAQWSPLYTITYNYGSGAIAPEVENPTSYTIKSESFTLNAPTRSGYTFAGWKETILLDSWTEGFVNKDTGALEPVSESFSNAIYTELMYVQKGREYTLNVNEKDGVRWRVYNLDGTYFNGYSTSTFKPNDSSYYVRVLLPWGTTDGNENNATITSTASTMTVDQGTRGNRIYTAQWQANSYTVAYDGNGAEGTMESSSHVYGTAKALNANSFTRNDGYAFTGWNTKADGTGTTYGNEAAVKNLTTEANGTVTLYAQWTNQDVYTITCDLGDGNTEKILYAKTTEEFTLKTPTKNGATFVGWEETIHLDSWNTGFVDKSGIYTNSSYPNAMYNDFVYLQKGRTYTLNVGGITTSDIRWRLYNLDESYYDNRNNGTLTLSASSYYVRILLLKGVAAENQANATITSSAISITVDKGTVGNRTYKAIWEDEVLP